MLPMKTAVQPIRMIDLTGHLSSLKGSLTPDTKLFEPAAHHWQLSNAPRSQPADWIYRIGIVFLLTLAAGTAALLLSHAQ